jgi:putative DNA primase/helicase
MAKDKICTAQYTELPNFLASKKTWVMWKAEQVDGEEKLRKTPKQINGQNARAGYDNTYTSYLLAKLTLEDDKISHQYNFSGIGIMFDKTFTGIDVDGCVENGVINEIGQDIIKTLNSYTEYSPSGNGIHIFVKGTINLEHNRNLKTHVEMYDAKRYFTVTENHVEGTPTDIIENEDGLVAVYMKYIAKSTVNEAMIVEMEPETKESVLELLRTCPQREKIGRLMSGDRSEYVNAQGEEDDSVSDLALCSFLAAYSRKNKLLMDQIFRESGLMRPKWDEVHGESTYGNMTINKACQDQLQMSEGGNAKRLVNLHGHNLKNFGAESKQWYFWNGDKWAKDVTKQVWRYAKDVINQLYTDAYGTSHEQIRKARTQFAKKSDTASGIKSMIEIASTQEGIVITLEEFDNNVMKCTAKGTTLNLANVDGIIQTPRRDDLISKTLGCAYVEDAKCPQWETFLSEIFNKDEELIEYMQTVVGYCLTGLRTEKCFWYLYGEGSNGKSIFMNVLSAMFGDYHANAAIQTFIQKSAEGSIRDDLYRLRGARFVTASEPNAGHIWDLSLIKVLTGGDPITCRTLHAANVVYYPQLKLMIAGNNHPNIPENTDAASERIREIPFTVQFKPTPNKKLGEKLSDPYLSDKLMTELPGILNWAIRGYAKFAENGMKLVTPITVRLATDKYIAENNSVSTFIREECVTSPGCAVQSGSADWTDEYERFCEIHGLECMRGKKKTSELRKLGIKTVRRHAGYVYMGVRLKTEEESQLKFE